MPRVAAAGGAPPPAALTLDLPDFAETKVGDPMDETIVVSTTDARFVDDAASVHATRA